MLRQLTEVRLVHLLPKFQMAKEDLKKTIIFVIKMESEGYIHHMHLSTLHQTRPVVYH